MNLFAILFSILLTDIINPVLLAGVIYGLGSKKPYLNSLLVLFGWFFLYLIAFVLGVSFSSDSALEHVIVDITWQMIEQSFGGLLIGYLYHVYKELRKAEAFQIGIANLNRQKVRTLLCSPR